MAAAVDECLQHQLFGGAIDIAFPARLIDVSDYREVPDNQEVGSVTSYRNQHIELCDQYMLLPCWSAKVESSFDDGVST